MKPTGTWGFALATLLVLLPACDTSPTEPEPGSGYILDRASVNRDFQPPTPDDRLTAFVRLKRLDGSDVPPSLTPTQIEVVLLSSGESWESGFWQTSYFEGEVWAWARWGPKWPVGEIVRLSVLVEDSSGGPSFRLSVARVEISSSS